MAGKEWPSTSDQMWDASLPEKGDLQPPPPLVLVLCTGRACSEAPLNGACSLTQIAITTSSGNSDPRADKEPFFCCQRSQPSSLSHPMSLSLPITHSSMAFICPSFPASQSSGLPSARFPVKLLSIMCSSSLIAHSLVNSSCSSLPWWLRALISAYLLLLMLLLSLERPITPCCPDVAGCILPQKFHLGQDILLFNPPLFSDSSEAVNLLSYFFC